MATRYTRETGKTFQRFIPHDLPDVLAYLAKARKSPRWSAYHQNQYLPARRSAMRPVLGQLRMIEAAIRCDVQCREAVQAFQLAVAA